MEQKQGNIKRYLTESKREIQELIENGTNLRTYIAKHNLNEEFEQFKNLPSYEDKQIVLGFSICGTKPSYRMELSQFSEIRFYLEDEATFLLQTMSIQKPLSSDEKLVLSYCDKHKDELFEGNNSIPTPEVAFAAIKELRNEHEQLKKLGIHKINIAYILEIVYSLPNLMTEEEAKWLNILGVDEIQQKQIFNFDQSDDNDQVLTEKNKIKYMLTTRDGMDPINREAEASFLLKHHALKLSQQDGYQSNTRKESSVEAANLNKTKAEYKTYVKTFGLEKK